MDIFAHKQKVFEAYNINCYMKTNFKVILQKWYYHGKGARQRHCYYISL